MKKVIILSLSSIISTSAFSYKIADYEKFLIPGDCKKCDLTQASFPQDISNLNFENTFFTGSTNQDLVTANNSNFSNANFVYVNVYNSEFKSSNFNHARLNNASFNNVSFINSSFVNAKMENSNFSYSNFTNVNFTNANLKNADLSHSTLYNSNITAAQLKSLASYECARLPNGDLFDDNGQIDCYNLANRSDKSQERHKKDRLKKLSQFSSQSDVDHFIKTKECTNCDLSNNHFLHDYYDDNLNNSNINSSDLRNSYFIGCDFSNSSLINNIIFGSTFGSGIFMRVNFENSKLDNSIVDFGAFSEASFKNASLRRVSFDHSNLSSVDFTNANTQGAVFNHSILIGSNISKEQIDKAKSMACSVLPNGDVVPFDDYECPNTF